MEKRDIIDSISFLNSDIYGYEFFQAVRIIESICKNKPCIGTTLHPHSEIVNFKQNPSLRTQTSDVKRCRFNIKESKIELTTNFLGLLGTNGIMPYFFTEELLSQMKSKNFAMLDFLNIFYNRMISFLYRAWAINNQTVSYEKGRNDYISKYLYSIIGYNYDSFNKNSSLSYDFKLYFAAHFARAEQSVESLCSIIREYFKVNAEVEEFFQQWIDIPQEAKTEFKYNNSSGILGRNTFIGDKAWNCTVKFKLVIGPMSIERYNSLLPGNVGFIQLKEILNLCSPVELYCDLVYVLKADEIPSLSTDNCSQLGYNSWLITEKPKKDQENFYIHNFRKTSNLENKF